MGVHNVGLDLRIAGKQLSHLGGGGGVQFTCRVNSGFARLDSSDCLGVTQSSAICIVG